jgi:probable rRNA maturation factor
VHVHVFQEQSDLSISESSITLLVSDFNQFSQALCDEVSIHLVDVTRICELHMQFFNDPSPTDCISFPMDEKPEYGYRIMGDVFVCPAVAKEYVCANGGDVYHEITLYVIHGLLHLQGLDDLSPKDRRKMRAAEAAYLAHVNEKKLWISEAVKK